VTVLLCGRMARLSCFSHYPFSEHLTYQYNYIYPKFYPKHPVHKMGKFTQNMYGIKWVKMNWDANISDHIAMNKFVKLLGC
jgi:hypothetical protein